MYMAGQICCLIYLLALSVLDIRSKKLPGICLLLGAGMALLYQLLGRNLPLILAAAGAAAGIVFLGISRITGEAFGYGDSLLILILGIYLGFWNLLCLLSLAFILAAGFAVIALFVRKFRRRTVFPFVPFLGIAYAFLLMSGGMYV